MDNTQALWAPKPVDTSGIELSSDVTALIELLADNAHAVWGKQRMDAGWTYGPMRNDETKQHPGLIPYAQLTEGEKDYDRVMAIETLKLIVHYGYKIVKG